MCLVLNSASADRRLRHSLCLLALDDSQAAADMLSSSYIDCSSTSDQQTRYISSDVSTDDGQRAPRQNHLVEPCLLPKVEVQ